MKKLVTIILAIALVAAIAYIYLLQSGYDIKAFFDKPKIAIKRIELRADCSPVQNLLVTSTVNVKVKNFLNRSHNNVTVRVTAYDKNKKVIKRKNIVFEETLLAHDSLVKPILLPAKARTAKCVFIKSNPIKKIK